jgi:triosephosphate isomerase (TIM)
MPKHRPPFIAGNWKMHMTVPETRALLGSIAQAAPDLGAARIVVIPPFTALAEASRLLAGSPVAIGAQNLFWEDKGAFTGEVSGPLLTDAGCRYVVVGHSERRQLFGETDAMVHKRLRAALRSGLIPILCVGETLEERDAGRTLDRVRTQFEGAVEGISPESFGSVVLAYEPVWAIGTGRTATSGQAEDVHAALREKIAENYGKDPAAYAIILYGGSVKPANSFSLFWEKDVDGFLVGGASLEAESFLSIVKEALRAYKEKA